MKKNESLRELVYNDVKQGIITGEYTLDDTITEKTLINKHFISKAPVRDALIELCNEGILESIPRYGYKIINYSREYLDSITNFRLLVEPKYLGLYWDRLSDENIIELENLHINDMEMAEKESIETYWKTNQDFHMKLASFYHDKFFYETLERAMSKQMIIFSQHYWGHWDKQVFNSYAHQHNKFIQLLKSKNKEKAMEELYLDIDTFMKK